MKTLSSVLLIISISVEAQQQDSIHVYYKCLNKMALSQLFPAYRPNDNTFKIKGARIRAFNKSNKNDIAILPDSSVVVVSLFKKNKEINTVNLYSVKPPAPVIELSINGKTYYSFGALNGPSPTLLEVNLVPDEVFKLNTPGDAIYKIVKWEVALRRGNQTLKLATPVDKTIPQKELGDIKQLAKVGDVLQIKLLSVERQNTAGEWVEQPLSRSSLLYTITK